MAGALVAACQQGDATEIRSLATQYPDASRYTDPNGYTALHHALESGASSSAIRALINASPDETMTAQTTPEQCTALHLAASCPSTQAAVVDCLLRRQPVLATTLDAAGRSALHAVCRGDGRGRHASIDVVRAVYQAWKEATYLADQSGHLPIHHSYLTGAPGSQIRYLASLDPQSVSAPLQPDGRLLAHAVADDLSEGGGGSSTGVLESLVLADPATLFVADPKTGRTLVQTARDPAFCHKLGDAAARFSQIIQTHQRPGTSGSQDDSLHKKGGKVDDDTSTKKREGASGTKQKMGLSPEVMANDLVMACSQNLAEKVRLVVNTCPEAVRVRDQEGFLPLHWACYHGAGLDILKLLLGAWPESVKENISQGRLPLHLACRQSASLDRIRFLVDKYPGALDAPTSQGMLPLHYACRDAAPLDVVQHLVDQGPMTISEQTNNNAALPIHLACKHGKSPEVIRFLAERWPGCLREPNSEGLLPIHFLCKVGSTVSVEWMIAQDPYLLEMTDAEGNLPLHVLCKNPKSTVEAVKMLLDIHPEAAKQTNKAGMTPADFAEGANTEVASFLSMQRQRRKAGPNPLHQACADPRVTVEMVIKILDESPDEVCVPDAERMLPIHVACRSGASLDVIRCLGEDWPESLRWTNKGGSLPLHTACSNQASASVIHYLITSWPKATTVANNYGWLPLHCACAYGASPEVISLLVRSNDKSSRMATYGQGDYPLHLACCGSPSLEVIYWLIEAREECVRLANAAGELALHKACFNNAPLEVIQFLVEQYPRSLFVEDQHGSTPQKIAELRKNHKVADWLKSKEV